MIATSSVTATRTLSPVWGPFDSPVDAADNLGRFTDLVLGPHVGIIWVGSGKMYAIRKPRYDAQGYGEIIAYEFGGRPVRTVAPGTGMRVRSWFGWVAREVSRGKAATGRVIHRIEGSASTLWRTNFGMTARQSDGAGVVLDAAGVGLSLAVSLFGPLELLGVLAAAGGGVLLLSDGTAYISELAGNDSMAKSIRYYTFWPRCIATVATLPDAAWGLGKVLTDSREMATVASRFLSTAKKAEAGSARVSDAAASASDPLAASREAALARRYADLGDRMQRKARSQQIRLAAYLSAQGGTRAVIPPGIVFLVKEATDDPDNRPHIQDILSRFTFHVSAVHRP